MAAHIDGSPLTMELMAFLFQQEYLVYFSCPVIFFIMAVLYSDHGCVYTDVSVSAQ